MSDVDDNGMPEADSKTIPDRFTDEELQLLEKAGTDQPLPVDEDEKHARTPVCEIVETSCPGHGIGNDLEGLELAMGFHSNSLRICYMVINTLLKSGFGGGMQFRIICFTLIIII